MQIWIAIDTLSKLIRPFMQYLLVLSAVAGSWANQIAFKQEIAFK
jgi:hypothetical protein